MSDKYMPCRYLEDGKCANISLMNYGRYCSPHTTTQCVCYDPIEDECIHYEEHSGKCLDGNNENYGEECFDPAKEKCRMTQNSYDQTAKADAGKPRLTLVPLKIIWAIAKVREFGMKKYKEEDNWKRVEIRRYRDAMFRHMLAYLAEPHGKDPESGLPILWHIATNCAFLIELESDEECWNANDV